MSSTALPLCYFHPDFSRLGPAGVLQVDLCVYGATPGGITAAIQAARLNHSVVLLEPGFRPGGMTASGLGFTDIGNKAAVGGLALEFYQRVGRHYGVQQAWTFEPHVAEEAYRSWLLEAGIPVHYRQFAASAEMEGKRISALRMVNGFVIRASMFIDATYEGDLMNLAGVTHKIGREDNSTYDETLNGAQIHASHQFESPVDPYIETGNPASGILPGIETSVPVIGKGDDRIQAYCFRMCLTDDHSNRRPFARPHSFDPRWYVLLERYFNTGWRDVFSKFDRLRVRTKTDTNNHGAVSTDFIGQNHAWPRATYLERERIFQAHVTYQQGLHWFLANSQKVPADVREQYSRWGLCKDEFVATDGWPTQLYVREARRLVGDIVMTEHECRGNRIVADPVGLAAYTMDSHNCRRFVTKEGVVLNEGDVQAHGFPPYPISYRAIVPRVGECENLLVPVCLSASHIAYGSIRMEPVFMILGQSAAVAAHLALSEAAPVQAVSYSDLRSELLKRSQVLAWTETRRIARDDLHAVES